MYYLNSKLACKDDTSYTPPSLRINFGSLGKMTGLLMVK